MKTSDFIYNKFIYFIVLRFSIYITVMIGSLQFVFFGRKFSVVDFILERDAFASFLLNQEILRRPRLLAILEHEDCSVVVDHVALSLDVIVPQTRLPQLGDLLGFFPHRVPGNGDESHHRATFLRLLEESFGIAHVDLRHVDRWSRPEMFRKLIRF